MNKTDLQFFLNENIQIDLKTFVLNLFVAIILSFLIQLTYNRISRSLSSAENFSRNFIVLGLTTTIIITIVKSSLALSLGLVGALSIVRFRAAIKEPEELVYLFLIIAIGLGCRANQLIITVVGILFSLLTILIYSVYIKKINVKSAEIINMGIIIDENITDTQVNKLIDDLTKDSLELRFISMSRTVSNTTINIDLRPKDFKDLTKLTGQIKEQYPKSKTILAHNDDLSL